MRNKGFTIVETVVGVAVFSLIAVGLIALVSFILNATRGQSNLLSNNDQATRLVFNVLKELRNAQTAANGSYAINTANNQQLIFYSDTGDTIDRINYFVQGGQLRKGVTKPTGSPPIYNLAGEVVTTVQTDLANGASPIFYYYDDTYNGVAGVPLAQPANLIQVKFIRINLSVYNRGGVANTNTYTVSAGGTIRNLKTNLGN